LVLVVVAVIIGAALIWMLLPTGGESPDATAENNLIDEGAAARESPGDFSAFRHSRSRDW
jgi:hypothetical protein